MAPLQPGSRTYGTSCGNCWRLTSANCKKAVSWQAGSALTRCRPCYSPWRTASRAGCHRPRRPCPVSDGGAVWRLASGRPRLRDQGLRPATTSAKGQKTRRRPAVRGALHNHALPGPDRLASGNTRDSPRLRPQGCAHEVSVASLAGAHLHERFLNHAVSADGQWHLTAGGRVPVAAHNGRSTRCTRPRIDARPGHRLRVGDQSEPASSLLADRRSRAD